MPEPEISRSKKLKPSKMSKLRGGLQIKHIASHRCQISSFEKGKSFDSFPGLRRHHRHHPRAPACGERSYDLVALLSFIFVSNAGYVGLRICSFLSDWLDVMLRMEER